MKLPRKIATSLVVGGLALGGTILATGSASAMTSDPGCRSGGVEAWVSTYSATYCYYGIGNLGVDITNVSRVGAGEYTTIFTFSSGSCVECQTPPIDPWGEYDLPAGSTVVEVSAY